MKSDRVRRNFWMPSEIDMMLKLLKKLHPSRGIVSTSHNAFVQIANKMKKCGFPNKTALQIRRKWFQMKSAYLCYKRGNVERLLLIPECFRPTIAQFVDAEAKYNKLPKTPAAKASEELKPQSSAAPISIPELPKPPKIIPPALKTKSKTLKIKNVASEVVRSPYQQLLEDFVVNSKKAHKLMVNDFKRMQEKLLAYQQECQMIRDANVRAFLEDAKFNFDT